MDFLREERISSEYPVDNQTEECKLMWSMTHLPSLGENGAPKRHLLIVVVSSVQYASNM
jgi:hypothetical protein